MQVKIVKFDDLGNGIARINDKICFVKKGILNEDVEIKIVKENKNYLKANIINIIKESKSRIKPICKYYDKCGGCQFLHMDFLLEKEFKIEKCKNYFSLCDSFYETSIYNYRDKVTLHVKNGNLGFYDEKTHELVSVDYCHLLLSNINEVIKILNDYKDIKFNGKVIIRENYNGEIMLVIEGSYKYINELKNKELVTNLVYNDKVLKGKDYFIENILNYKFKVHYNSFFQVNRLGLLNIYKVLNKFLENKNINTTLDLYSGTSVLGILLSKYSGEVISVEVNKFATNDALVNLELNNINNLSVINDKVENVIDKFHDVDLVIIDPARRGLDTKTINYLKEIKSKYLIYIACGIDALKRDIKEIEEVYNLDNLYVIDMFPRTNKMECMAIFSLM